MFSIPKCVIVVCPDCNKTHELSSVHSRFTMALNVQRNELRLARVTCGCTAAVRDEQLEARAEMNGTGKTGKRRSRKLKTSHLVH